MNGREDPKENDLFFTCSLIDYIARKTKNKRSVVVNALGKELIAKIYELADRDYQFTLSISLHATNDKKRSELLNSLLKIFILIYFQLG